MRYIYISIFIFTLIIQSAAQLDVTVLSKSCDFVSNGVVWLDFDASLKSQYPGSHLIQLENEITGEYWEQTTPLDPDVIFAGVSPGFCNITVFLPGNCTLTQKVTVGTTATNSLTLSPSIEVPGCEVENGSIFVLPTGGNQYYFFEWSDGYDAAGVSSSRTALGEGQYCVTVTDSDCGYAEACYILREPVRPDFQIDYVNLNSCTPAGVSTECNGSVLLTLSEEYDIQWTGPSGFLAQGNVIDSLCHSGIYNYAISYSEECEEYNNSIYLFCCENFPDPLDVSLEADWNCTGGYGTASLEIDGGLAPFDIIWSTGDTTEELSNLEEQVYSVTVTDARKCQKILEHNFDVVEILNEVPACEGIWDGAITIQINNPNGVSVDVNYNFAPCGDCITFPLIVDDTSEVIVFTLDELAGNTEYTFYIVMSGCIIPFTFVLDEVSFERKYNSFYYEDDAYYCVYDLECSETLIDSGEIVLASIDLDEEGCGVAEAGSCGTIKYYCDDNEEPVATKKVKRDCSI